MYLFKFYYVFYLYVTSTSTFRFIIIAYYWIIITGYCKHEFGTINMLYSLKKLSYYNPTSPQQPLSSVPKVSVRLYVYFSFLLWLFFSFSIRTTSSNRLTASGSMEVCIYCTSISACLRLLKYIAHAGANKKSLFPSCF